MPGLISTADFTVLYNNILGPGSLESETAALWTPILARELSIANRFYHAAEQHPPGIKQRVDLAFFRIVNGRKRIVCYVEFKRYSLSAAARRSAIRQVTRYCHQLLTRDRSINTVPAVLCIGTEIAYWRVGRQQGAGVPQPPFHDATTSQARDVRQMLGGIRSRYT